ncbi:hypothetical protein F8M41_006820 [Gigaspora margarita]|uniref:Uncharacterized protein n=1 Tax=Gigaspora margarita TaxID=4874 RepID=A0A8H4A4S3_GIGMA|nr:hypothetical protein F8M41_006820 [Gigaspora margarita]
MLIERLTYTYLLYYNRRILSGHDCSRRVAGMAFQLIQSNVMKTQKLWRTMIRRLKPYIANRRSEEQRTRYIFDGRNRGMKKSMLTAFKENTAALNFYCNHLG